MFSQLATALTLLAMLVHSMLGCCWHHSHGARADSGGCAVDGDHRDEVKSKSPPRVCCGHRHAPSSAPASRDATDENSPSDNPRGCCEEGSCVYTTSSEVKLPSDFVQFASLMPPMRETLTLCLHSVAVLATIENGHPARPAAEVRAEWQVWLI